MQKMILWFLPHPTPWEQLFIACLLLLKFSAQGSPHTVWRKRLSGFACKLEREKLGEAQKSDVMVTQTKRACAHQTERMLVIV